MAMELHHGQKHGRTTTMEAHLRRVWQAVRDAGGSESMQIVAWLHESVRKGRWGRSDLEAAGLPPEEVRAVFLSFEDRVSTPRARRMDPETQRSFRWLGVCRHGNPEPPLTDRETAAPVRIACRLICAKQAWGCHNPVLFRYREEHRRFRKALYPWLMGDQKNIGAELDRVLDWEQPRTNGRL